MLSPENIASLVRDALYAPQNERPDRLFHLVKAIAGDPPPDDAPLEWKQQYDVAYGALDCIFSFTSYRRDAFESQLSSTIEANMSV